MSEEAQWRWRRRVFLRSGLALPGLFLLQGAGRTNAQAQALPPTPSCADNGDLTPPQTAGPFYKPRSPNRSSLIEPGMKGTKMLVQGYVRSTRCESIPGALVDLWQADGAGVYDNAGYKLRGHQYTDRSGRYSFDTIVPGLYPGRTRHLHVRVQAPNSAILTTQLYFPGEPQNRRDRIFNEKLLLRIAQNRTPQVASFDFALDLG